MEFVGPTYRWDMATGEELGPDEDLGPGVMGHTGALYDVIIK